jgi:hypothetical protein
MFSCQHIQNSRVIPSAGISSRTAGGIASSPAAMAHGEDPQSSGLRLAAARKAAVLPMPWSPGDGAAGVFHPFGHGVAD